MRNLFTTSIAAAATVLALFVSPAAGATVHAKHRRARLTGTRLAPARPPARLDVECPAAGTSAADADANAFASALLCLVNQERARYGMGALVARPLLAAVGLRHADAMVTEDFFGHAEPGGLSYRTRIFRAGYFHRPAIRFIAGENIAWSAGDGATPRAVVSDWMSSPGHRAEILDRRFRDAGVGVVLASPPSLTRERLPGVTAAMEFGALGYATARVARNLHG